MRSQTLGVTYIPVDVSEEFLRQTGRALQRELPSLVVEPVVSDISVSLDLPPTLREPVLFAFLGSTIGNFDDIGAISLLRRVRSHMRGGDRLLLGTDLRKDRATIEAAYNDRAGVTAEFNRNMLRVLNAELGADFVPERWAHHAFYNGEAHRIEMHLCPWVYRPYISMACVTSCSRTANRFARAEPQYDRAAVDSLAAAADLRVTHWFIDGEQRFALSPSSHGRDEQFSRQHQLLSDAIRAESFSPAAPTRRVGAEVELLVLDAATAFPVPLVSGRRNLVQLLRPHAARNGWREAPGYGTVPVFVLPGQGTISFEPGGQLEISTDPRGTVTDLVALLDAIVRRCDRRWATRACVSNRSASIR
jgi:hypothetical protein